jgi:hypothetical protein
MKHVKPETDDDLDLDESIDFDKVARLLLAMQPKPQSEVRPDPNSKRGRPKKTA